MKIKDWIRKIALGIIHKPRQSVVVKLVKADYQGILTNHAIVITGGSRGIGFAIARKFADEGAKVLITGRNAESLEVACRQIGINAKMLVQDVSKIEDFDSFIRDCEVVLNESVTGFVLNAGISYHEGNFLNVTQESYDQQMNTNLRANFFIAQAFINKLIEKSKQGNILFISSETAGKSNDLPYGLAKLAINSLVGGLARRVYQKGIRVNAIAPGVTLTDMKKGKDLLRDDYANSSVAGRFLLPEETAEIACFMMSDLSKCISGEIIYCDAGSHLKINGLESEYSL